MKMWIEGAAVCSCGAYGKDLLRSDSAVGGVGWKEFVGAGNVFEVSVVECGGEEEVMVGGGCELKKPHARPSVHLSDCGAQRRQGVPG